MACCPKSGVKRKNVMQSLADRKFTPKFEKALTEKFYSKYEYVDPTVKIPESIGKDIETFQKRKHDLKSQFYAPYTENQVYGWYDNLAKRQKLDETDREVMSYSRKSDEIISTMNTIYIGLKHMGMK